jgi:hypothetical protein
VIRKAPTHVGWRVEMASVGLVWQVGWSPQTNVGVKPTLTRDKDESVPIRSPTNHAKYRADLCTRYASVHIPCGARLTNSMGDAAVDVNSHVSPSVRFAVNTIGRRVPLSRINKS